MMNIPIMFCPLTPCNNFKTMRWMESLFVQIDNILVVFYNKKKISRIVKTNFIKENILAVIREVVY